MKLCSSTAMMFLCLAALVLQAPLAKARSYSPMRHFGEREVAKRNVEDVDSHGHEEDEDEHGHEEEEASQCAVTSHDLAHDFSELSEELGLLGEDGAPCRVEEEEEHHDEEEEGEEHHDDMDLELGNGTCGQTFGLVRQLLVRLNLTTPCCIGLGNSSTCEHKDEKPAPGSSRTPAAQAYGYGFLMVILVSLASLLGLVLLPLAQHPRLKRYYVYVYALLISLGASALFCDAVLHLIPEAFGLHGHGEEEGEAAGDGHAHSEEEEEEELLIIWRSCVVVLGMYGFFIFEFVLHSFIGHTHTGTAIGTHSHSDTTELVDMNGTPNGERKSTASQDSPVKSEEKTTKEAPKEENIVKRFGHFLYNMKPLAWLIILGDGAHNFADGIALGAAISQSLSLGISTTIALIFHEVPHEVGDYFVLLSTGLSWYVALLFNFLSALTAVIGFFVGVAIGTSSEEANNWILAATAGIFLYIALVDLLPELIHIKAKGWQMRAIILLLINVGFIFSFIILLILAIYEEDLNSLVEV